MKEWREGVVGDKEVDRVRRRVKKKERVMLMMVCVRSSLNVTLNTVTIPFLPHPPLQVSAKLQTCTLIS